MNVPTNLRNDKILAALEATNWNLTRAAKKLNCHPSSLRTSVIKRFPTQYAAKKADGSIRHESGWLRPGVKRRNVSLPSDYTDEQLIAALEAAAWNVTRAAATLGCNRESLRLSVMQRLPEKYAEKKADGSVRAVSPKRTQK